MIFQQISGLVETDRFSLCSGPVERVAGGRIASYERLSIHAASRRGEARDGSPSGFTALHKAIKNGHLSIVKYLLDKGANVEAELNTSKERPIHLAVKSGVEDSDIIDRRLEIDKCPVNFYVTTKSDESDGEILVELLKQKPDVNACDKNNIFKSYELDRAVRNRRTFQNFQHSYQTYTKCFNSIEKTKFEKIHDLE